MPRDSLHPCLQAVRTPAAPHASTLRRASTAPRAFRALPAVAVWLSLLAFALGGCGTGAMDGSPAITHSASGFTLTVLPESFSLGGSASAVRLDIGQDGAETLVRVVAQDARGLKALYCKLDYDAGRLTPLSAGAGDIWPPGGSIQLSVLDRPGAAYFGSVLIHPDAQPGLSGSATLAVFRFRQGAMSLVGPARAASGVPPRTARSAAIVSLDAPTKVLSWGYYNNGDYDQNQLVSLSDLQPIAVHFGEGSGSPFDPASVQSVIDGNEDGAITLGDMQPIAANFQIHVSGYNVYVSTNASDAPSSNGEASKIAFTAHLEFSQVQGVKTAERLHLAYTFSDIVGDKYYWVRPADAADEGTPSNILHHNEPPPQQPPTLALTNPGTGTGTAADPYIVDTVTDYVFSLTDPTDGNVSTNTQSTYTVTPASAGTISNTNATLNIDDAFFGDITVGASYKSVAVPSSGELHLRVPQPTPGQSGTIDIKLPSLSTGSPSGKLSVRLLSPLPANTYFPQGAPVIILVPDGNVNGAVATTDTWPKGMEGFLYITFVFPGGSQSGFTSDGSYDNRGQACIDALRDVILFATNQKNDDQGKSVQDICQADILTGNVGLLGQGNGGPICFTTAKQYGAQFSGLKYVIAWESPSNSQTVCMDAGHVGKGVNFWGSGPMMTAPPSYVFPGYTYGMPVLNIDYSHIASQGGQTGRIFHDGNSNGIFDTIARPGDGYNTPDVDQSGVIEPGEDFCFGFLYTEGSKKMYSQQVIQALWDNNIFPHASWPAWLPNPTEASAFWLLRDAALNFGGLAAVRPDLKLLILASNQDHAQAPPDRPHIRQMFDGFTTNSMWVKLNPAAASVVAVEPLFNDGTNDPTLPTMAPNAAPGDWTVYDYCYPASWPLDGIDTSGMVAINEGAGAQEMATLVN